LLDLLDVFLKVFCNHATIDDGGSCSDDPF
jgi:hypothetical protein